MKFKRILALVLLAAVLPFSAAAQEQLPQYSDPFRAEDEEEVKCIFDTKFPDPLDRRNMRYMVSGWAYAVVGGYVKRADGGGLLVKDESEELPTSFARELEPVQFGEVEMAMNVHFSDNLEGAYWGVYSDKKPILKLVVKGTNIVLEGKDKDTVVVLNHKLNWYYFKLSIDVDKRIITRVQVDGSTVAENIPFLTDISNMDEVIFGTSEKCTGQFQMGYFSMYRGYKIRELFEHGTSIVPADWKVISGSAKTENSSIVLDNSGNGSVVRRDFTRETRKTASEFYIEAPGTGSGIEVAVKDGDKNVFSVLTTEKGFAYKTNNQGAKEFYIRMPSVAYNFSVRTDYDKHTADLYMNNRIMEKNIPIASDITGADNITIVQTGGLEKSGVTGVMVYPVIEYDNYVPEPVVPEKDDIDIIMQMCPMWNEGYHFGYDALKSSPGREPLIGCYDEGSPEASDWNIKHMVEHGVDVRESTWYRTSGGPTPVREYNLQGQYKAMQNAKYADRMKWFLKWENSGGSGGSTGEENLKNFLTTIAPFWIEYYFKDPNYYKINGRPVVGFYYYWSLGSVFGNNIPTGIKQFRQLCIDAGVGNPILLMDIGEGYFNDINTMGFDMQSQYHRGGTYPEKVIESNNADRDSVLKNGYKFQAMPSVNPGFSDYAWQLNVGPLWDKAMMKTALEDIRDNYFGTAYLPLGRKTLRLCTWDEYGEGHYFGPTHDRGFDFLDAVYETFVGDKPHTDVLPDTAQKDRINNRYPAWKKPDFYYEAPYREYIPDDSELKYSYKFDSEQAEWSPVGATAEMKDGKLVLTSTAASSYLMYQPDKNIELSDITHVKLRIKNNSSAYFANLWYKSNMIKIYDDKHKFMEHMYRHGEDYVDIVYPMEKMPLDWRGQLTELQFRFSPLEKGETLEIESVEFYGNKIPAEEINLTINNYTQHVDALKTEDTAMVPLRKLGWGTLFDDEISYNAETDTAIYRVKSSKTVAFMPLGGTEFTINGEKYPSKGYYTSRDGVCYVSPKWAEAVLGKTASYDEELNTFSIKDKVSVSFERPISERKLLWSEDFDSGTGGFAAQGGAKIEGRSGSLNILASGGDPGMIRNLGGISMDCSNAKKFVVRLKSSAALIYKIYFTTSTHGTLSESCAWDMNVDPSTDYKEYVWDLEDEMNWDGTLNLFRIDIEQGNDQTIDVDYMRFYGDYETELTEEEIANRFDSMEKEEDGYVWNFNINNTRDGWKFSKSVADVAVDGGQISMNVIAPNAEMTALGNLDLNAEDIKHIKIRMKTDVNAKNAVLKFVTDSDGEYSADKQFNIALSGGNTAEEYVIKTADNANWKGKIKGLKLVPSDGKGSVSIDYIKLSFR